MNLSYVIGGWLKVANGYIDVLKPGRSGAGLRYVLRVARPQFVVMGKCGRPGLTH
jgi:hypothetical protein